MKKPKLSIIVCVYNTEKYVERCINSLLNQTYENFEIVIVDDCSTDKSSKIVKKLSKDNRIKLIENEKNSGLSYSRNTGLENATGEYIGYVDSDDYVMENYYENLMNSIIKEKADLAICDLKIVYEDENNREVISKCSNDKFSKLSVIDNGLAASACNKVFKRELIEKYKFEVGKVNEDIAVVIPAIVNAKKVVYAPETYYYYVQRNSSIQNSRFSEKRFDIFSGVDLTLERIKGCKSYDKIKDAIIYEQLIVLLIYVIPKEKNLFRRNRILRKFNKLSKKYEIRKNRYFWSFLAHQGRKHSIYYKLIFKLNCSGMHFLTNMAMLSYEILKVILGRKLIKKADMNDLIKCAKKQSKRKNEQIKISVVVPNYNYQAFLFQRIYSILNQNYKIHELIILDDCSKDDSRPLIDTICEKLENYIDIKKVYNTENSGSAFKQWEKGFSLANGDYVWIAEADDYCDHRFLKNVVKPINENNNIVISYSNTAFIDAEGSYITKSITPEIDIMKTGHWNNSYINNGIDEYNNYSFLNCTIANVSSTLIKKNDYSKFFKISGNYRQAGDWIFYVNVMRTGDIAFNSKPLNYYRVHGNNISSVFKKQAHLDEIQSIHKYYDKNYKLTKHQNKEIEKRYKFLIKAWDLKK